MTHAHNEQVAARLLEDWLERPEPWETCLVPSCSSWRRGLVCEAHWAKASARLKRALRPLVSPQDDEEIVRLLTSAFEPSVHKGEDG